MPTLREGMAPVLGEALIGTAVVIGTSVISDQIVASAGLGEGRSISTHLADAFEAFTYSATTATWAHYRGWHQAKDTLGFFGQSVGMEAVGTIMEGFSLSLTAMTGAAMAALDGSDDARERFRAETRDAIGNIFGVRNVDPGGGGPTSVIGLIFSLLSARSSSSYQKLPVLRSLNSRSISIIQKNVTKAIAVPGTKWADSKFQLGIEDRLNELADSVTDSLVDFLFPR